MRNSAGDNAQQNKTLPPWGGMGGGGGEHARLLLPCSTWFDTSTPTIVKQVIHKPGVPREGPVPAPLQQRGESRLDGHPAGALPQHQASYYISTSRREARTVHFAPHAHAPRSERSQLQHSQRRAYQWQLAKILKSRKIAFLASCQLLMHSARGATDVNVTNVAHGLVLSARCGAETQSDT